MNKQKQWTKEELNKHIKINSTEKAGTYSMAVVLSAFYMKIYGELPKIGLSGFQGENAVQLSKLFPDK